MRSRVDSAFLGVCYPEMQHEQQVEKIWIPVMHFSSRCDVIRVRWRLVGYGQNNQAGSKLVKKIQVFVSDKTEQWLQIPLEILTSDIAFRRTRPPPFSIHLKSGLSSTRGGAYDCLYNYIEEKN